MKDTEEAVRRLGPPPSADIPADFAREAAVSARPGSQPESEAAPTRPQVRPPREQPASRERRQSAANRYDELPPDRLLDQSVLLGPKVLAPSRGWRRLLHRASGGRVTPALSAAEQADLALDASIRQVVRGCVVIAVVSTKGGIGKTTVSAMLGHTLATVRPDRVLSVDGNPDHGNLADKVGRQTSSTIVELLERLDDIASYSELSGFLSQSLSRLQVLAAPTDPSISTALTGEDYKRVIALLRRHVNVVVADCGTGLLDSATQGILEAADHLVVVLGQAADVTRVSAETYDWLEAHGHGELAARSVAVVNNIDPQVKVNLAAVDRFVAAHGRASVHVPRDQTLASGARAELSDLAAPTRQAYRQLAAAVAQGFALPKLGSA